jgi:hypothetical protein
MRIVEVAIAARQRLLMLQREACATSSTAAKP